MKRISIYVIIYLVFAIFGVYSLYPATAFHYFYSDKDFYYRYEIVKFYLEKEFLENLKISGYRLEDLSVRVYKDSEVVEDVLGRGEIYFDGEGGIAKWFIPWNPELGIYKAVLFLKGKPIDMTSFIIGYRKVENPYKKKVFLTLESNLDFSKVMMEGPNGYKDVGYKAVVDWAKFLGADGVMILAGQSAGWQDVSPQNPWSKTVLNNAKIIGRYAKEQGLIVGAYIMCFLGLGNVYQKLSYLPNYKYEDGKLVVDPKYISISSEKRIKDIVMLAKELNELPFVDIIGLDFIRTGDYSGFELAWEFFNEMGIKVGESNPYIYLGKKIRGMEDWWLRNAWNWWRAHKVSTIIRRIRAEAGIYDKKMWGFVLGWDAGHQHGQDPFMFSDAGLDIVAVMLYQINANLFDNMEKFWKEYTKKNNLTVNIYFGNQIDSNLLDPSKPYFSSVDEYLYRLERGLSFINRSCDGIFIHDVSRLVWGRKGGFSTMYWALSIKRFIAKYKYENVVGINDVSRVVY